MIEENAVLRFFVGIYSLVRKSGLLNQPWSQRIFSAAYFSYKRYFEDPYFALLKVHPELLQHGHVLDIGANIGYTATLFALGMDPEFRVYAFEPESSNFDLLKRNIERSNLRARIVAVQAAVGERSGPIDLWRNADHHGDHRVLTSHFRESGVAAVQVVPAVMTTVDDFLSENNLGGSIIFVKIDVQGYELSVCQGMEKALSANPRMVVALEYTPQAMLDLGFVPSDLPVFFRKRGYRIHLISGAGRSKGAVREVSDDELSVAVRDRGYVDILACRQAL